MFENLKNKIQENNAAIFLSGFFLILFIFFNVLISSVFLIFKVSIKKSFPVIALVLAVLVTTIFLRKKQLLNEKKQKIKNILITIVFPIFIIIFAIIMNGKIYDYTWDGNSYQKATTGMLALGWNPLYEELEEFDDKSEEQINIGDESPIYINNYAKASNIFAANIYKFTGNIETGKSINTLAIVILFLFTFSFLIYKNKSIFFSILFSVAVVTYPVVCAQFLTNYIDVLVYAFLYLTILSFFIFEEENFIFSKSDNLILFFIIVSLAINIKFSLFGYVGIYCLVYYIWYCYRYFKGKIDRKFFIKFTANAFFATIVGVLVIGLSVYPKNLIDHGNPFYPLLGGESVDIMTNNQPEEFYAETPIKKFLISLFSKSEDIIGNSKEKINLKIPFTISKGEIWNVGLPDLRLAGNGVLFSGIFLISLIIIISYLIKMYNKKTNHCMLFLLPSITTLIMIFFLHEAWWARYFPQLYIFVIWALVLLNENIEKKENRFFQYLFICVLLINNFITFQESIKKAYINNVKCNVEFQLFDSVKKTKNSNLVVYTISFNGAKFNVIDKIKDEKIIFINEYPKDKTDVNTFFDGKVEWRYESE